MGSTRWMTIGAGLFLLTVLIPTPSDAGQKGGGPQKSGATRPSTPKGPTAKATKPAASTTVKATGAGKTTGAGKSVGAGKSASAGKATSGGSTTAPGPRARVSNVEFTPTNAVAAKAATKPQLLEKFAALLPGTDLNMATAGFKNFGQFVAAVNVSNNLGIPFADLKAAMTGTTLEGVATGEPTLSLGQAIQELKPGADTDAEVQLATTQAASLDQPPAVVTTTTATRPKTVQSASR